jgi:hypothetical protein
LLFNTENLKTQSCIKICSKQTEAKPYYARVNEIVGSVLNRIPSNDEIQNQEIYDNIFFHDYKNVYSNSKQ